MGKKKTKTLPDWESNPGHWRAAMTSQYDDHYTIKDIYFGAILDIY